MRIYKGESIYGGTGMRILIAGGSGFRNAGDEALMRGAAQECLREAPGAALVAAANDRDVTSYALAGMDADIVSSLRIAFFRGDGHYGACDGVFRERWRTVDALLRGSPSDMISAVRNDPALGFVDRGAAAAFLGALAGADRLVVHGGGVLTSSTRSRLWEFALLARLAKRLGVPAAFRSHQLGPFDCEEDAALAREMLDSCAFVSVRDRGASLKEALAAGAAPGIFEDVDDAFLLEEPEPADAALERLGLRRGGYICACYRDNPWVGVGNAARGLFISAVSGAAELSGLPVVLVPLCPPDLSALSDIASVLPGNRRIVVPGDWLWDQMAVAGGAFLTVSLPHHPLIFSLRRGVPVISPVEGAYYRLKNSGSMRWFGMEDCVFDAAEKGAEAAMRGKLQLAVSENSELRRKILAASALIGTKTRRGRAAFGCYVATGLGSGLVHAVLG